MECCTRVARKVCEEDKRKKESIARNIACTSKKSEEINKWKKYVSCIQ